MLSVLFSSGRIQEAGVRESEVGWNVSRLSNDRSRETPSHETTSCRQIFGHLAPRPDLKAAFDPRIRRENHFLSAPDESRVYADPRCLLLQRPAVTRQQGLAVQAQVQASRRSGI